MSNYQESTSGTLPFYNTGYEQMLQAGQTAAQTPYQGYTGQQVAGLNSQQQQAFNLAGSNVNNWLPGINQAQGYAQGATTAGVPYYNQAQAGYQGALGTNLQGLGQPQYNLAQNALTGAMGTNIAGAGQLQYNLAQNALTNAMGTNIAGAGQQQYGQAQGMFAGSSQFDPSQLQQYLNPYLSGVVSEIGRLGQQQFSDQIIPGISNAYSSLGQFGSARQGMALSDAAARNQREVLGQQGQFLQQGYDSAMGNYGDWANRQQSAASGIAGIGQQQANQLAQQASLGMQGANALQGLGAQQASQLVQQAGLGMQGANALQGLGAQQFTQGLGQAGVRMDASQGLQNIGKVRSGEQLDAASSLGNLAQARQQLGIGDYGQLLNAGQLQQTQQQRQLDSNFANYMDQRNYPWQQVQNWSGLFQGSPNATSQWGATFKKGGLARFKKGGVVRNMAEGGSFGSDIDSLLSEQLRQQSPLTVDAYARRLGLMDQMRKSPALQQRPEPHAASRIGRGLMDAAAQGPAHWGQILGRAGKSYFDQEDALAAENAAREMTQFAMADKLLPQADGGRGRSGGMFESKVVPGVGLVKFNPDTGKAEVAMRENRVATMLPQLYAHAVREASAAQWPDEATKRQWIDNRVQEMLTDAANRGAGVVTPGENSLPGGMPPGVTPVGARAPRFEAMGGDIEKAARDIESIADPVERQMASEALQSSYGQPAAQEAWPSAFQTGQILSPQEAKESERVGAGLGDMYTNLQQGANDARSKLNQVNRIGQLLEDVTTGKLTPIITEVQGWAEAIGVPIKFTEGLSAKQAAQSLMGQFALQLRNPEGGAGMPGALSDRDLVFLQSMVPSLANTNEGNRLILDTFRKLSERSIKVAELAREYRRSNPRGTFDDGFQDYLAKWSTENPMFGDMDFKQLGLETPSTRGTPKVGDIIDGYELIGEDYRNKANWRKVE